MGLFRQAAAGSGKSPFFYKDAGTLELRSGGGCISVFGLPFLLELFESKLGARSRTFTALNLFNWKRETASGFAFFRDDRRMSPEGFPEKTFQASGRV